MDRIYFTITGTSHYYGLDFIKEGMKVALIKEPDNKADREAIKVEMEGLDTVGHVANSPYTVLGRSFSAGRLYDKIGDTASGTVLYILPNGVLCSLDMEMAGDAGEDAPDEGSKDSSTPDDRWDRLFSPVDILKDETI